MMETYCCTPRNCVVCLTLVTIILVQLLFTNAGSESTSESRNNEIDATNIIKKWWQQDKELRKKENETWSKTFYGNFFNDNFGLCCIMSTMWHEQESWKISLKIWLHECDCILLFVDSIDPNDNIVKNTTIGDTSIYTYKSLNNYVGTLTGQFTWVLPTNINKPTLFIDTNNIDKELTNSKLMQTFWDKYQSLLNKTDLDFDIQLSPFRLGTKSKSNNDKQFWIIPLNSFIVNQLINTKHGKFWSHNVNNNDVPLYGHLDVWDKTAAMLIYLYKYHSQECKWIVKMDSDSFVSIPTMKAYLSYYNHNVGHYLGSPQLWRLNTMGQEVAFQGGAFMALSIKALKRVLPQLLTMQFDYNYSNLMNNQKPPTIELYKNVSNRIIMKCVRSHGVGEDVMLGICMRNVGIIPENSKDLLWRKRFLMAPSDETWQLWLNDKNGREIIINGKKGFEHRKMSPFPLGFHNLKIEKMGKNDYKNIILDIYNQTVNINRNIYNIWNYDKTRMQNDLLMGNPRPFTYESWQYKNKLVNVSQFVEKVINCYYCNHQYPNEIFQFLPLLQR